MNMKEREYSGFYKDFLEGRVALSTTNSVFSNSECLFCEFNDIICPTWLAIIDNLRRIKPEGLDKYIDFSSVENLDVDHLIMWYAVRQNRNALLDLKVDGVSDDIINKIADALFDDVCAYYNGNKDMYLLNYAYTLKKTIRSASLIIKKFVIYVEQCNETVDKFLSELYPNRVDVRSGDLVAALSNIPKDSTYVFSDVGKINALIKADKINGSSILLADGFGYNYKTVENIGKNEDLIVDIDALHDKYLFEFNTFNNFTDD